MPKRIDIHKILVIGSGPIVIGQAAEFDYAGTQACLALSPVRQVLIEKSVKGYKEIEYEVMRDRNDTAITILAHSPLFP